jgi:hypothetical protein
VDAWICRACWNRNKVGADRCAVCRTSRYAEDRDVEVQRRALQEAETTVDEVVPDGIVAVPVAVFLAMVWVQKISAIFVVLFTLLVAPLLPLFLPFGGLLAGIYWVVGKVYKSVVAGMRDREAWAFLVGMLLTGVIGVGGVFGLVFGMLNPDVIAQQPEWARSLGVTVYIWLNTLVNLGAAACAFAGLVLTLTRPRSPVA